MPRKHRCFIFQSWKLNGLPRSLDPRRLAAELAAPPSAIGRLCDRMEAAGLLTTRRASASQAAGGQDQGLDPDDPAADMQAMMAAGTLPPGRRLIRALAMTCAQIRGLAIFHPCMHPSGLLGRGAAIQMTRSLFL